MIRFILQPIVENAFVHGMNSRSYKGKIAITASRTAKDVYISVSDNGSGIEANRLSAIQTSLKSGNSSYDLGPMGSIGLVNVNRRLHMQYGEGYGLAITSSPVEGTKVVIRIPY